MEISAYQLIEQLDSFPKTGLVEFSLSGNEIWLRSATANYEAVGEQTIKVSGRSAYGLISFDESTMLIDVDEIEYIRHSSGESN